MFQEPIDLTPKPYDQFEQNYLRQQGKIIPEMKQPSLKQQIKDAEKKIKELNRDYNQLKNRGFQVRRGRNNRIFYKSMAKTIFDYDTSEETTKSSHDSTKKRNFDDMLNCDSSYLDKVMVSQ